MIGELNLRGLDPAYGPGDSGLTARELLAASRDLQSSYAHALAEFFSHIPDRTVATMTLDRIARSLATALFAAYLAESRVPCSPLDQIRCGASDGWIDRVWVDWSGEAPASEQDLHDAVLDTMRTCARAFDSLIPMSAERRWLILSESVEAALRQVGGPTWEDRWAQWCSEPDGFVPASGARLVSPRPVRRVCCFWHGLRPKPELCASCPAR